MRARVRTGARRRTVSALAFAASWLVAGGCKGREPPPTPTPGADETKAEAVRKPTGKRADPTPPLIPVPKRPDLKPLAGQMVLDGELIDVSWQDGDSFSFREGEERVRTRLADYNTLESYSPVHQWGRWHPDDLLDLAKEAGAFAKAGGWHCERTGSGGGYGRIAVRCPGLALRLVSQGLAHVFRVDGPAQPDDSKPVGRYLRVLLAAQQSARTRKVGMWLKGAPEAIVTSLHSKDEKGAKGRPYDRVTDTRTGLALAEHHDNTHELCHKICHRGSCMYYIPYERRFGKTRAICKAH